MGLIMDGWSNEAKAAEMAKLSPERREQIILRALPGETVPMGVTDLAEALERSGAGFEVEQRPLLAVVDGETVVEVPNQFANLRTDTWAPLGVVGTRYNVGQTMDQLAPVAVLVERGDIQLTSVQVWHGGARVRVSGLLGTSVIGELPHGEGPDVLAHFGMFEASHDGSKSTTGAIQTLRCRCLNGLTAWDMVAKYSVRHTKNAADRLAEASRLVLGFSEDVEQEVRKFQALRAQPMAKDEFETFARQLLDQVRGAMGDEPTDRMKTRREREVQELLDLFEGGQGNAGETLWDGFNSVTEWIDHQRNRKGEQKYDFDSAAFGSGNKVKARALRMLTR